MTKIIERLKRHAAGHRSVADHSNDVTVIGRAGISSYRKAVGVAENGGGMTVLNEVMTTFLPRRVARKAVGAA